MDWLLGIAGAVWASHLHCLSVREREKKVVYTLIGKAHKFEIGDFEFRTLTKEIPFLKDDLVILEEIY